MFTWTQALPGSSPSSFFHQSDVTKLASNEILLFRYYNPDTHNFSFYYIFFIDFWYYSDKPAAVDIIPLSEQKSLKDLINSLDTYEDTTNNISSSDIPEVSLCQKMTDALQMTTSLLENKSDIPQDNDNLLIDINSPRLHLDMEFIENSEIINPDVSI